MSWLDIVRDPIDWRCVYCGAEGELPYHASFAFKGETYHLHRCSGCRSLIYDPKAMGPLFGLTPPEDHSRLGMKYYFESGYSPSFTVECVLATIPELDPETLRGFNFLDIGAGNGVGSFIARDLFGLETLAVEPSFTGELARENFGLRVERKYFEEIDATILGRLQSKPCLVHLDAVIEHLNDPRALLQKLVASLDIHTLCGLVPDGDGIDKSDPFSTSAPFLAPSDHVHLPTAEGMDRLFADLGFPHRRVTRSNKLLIVTGSREPIALPSPQRALIVTEWLLERLSQHPEPAISGGAIARQLIGAIGRREAERAKALSARLPPGFDPAAIVKALEGDAPWSEIPFYCGELAFWLAVDLVYSGKPEKALAFLDATEAYAPRITRDYPEFAMQPQLYKWEARLLRAQALQGLGRRDEAAAALRSVLDGRADPFCPPPSPIAIRAEQALSALSPAAAA